MKILKTTLLKASMIMLGLQPIISNAQWSTSSGGGTTNYFLNATATANDFVLPDQYHRFYIGNNGAYNYIMGNDGFNAKLFMYSAASIRLSNSDYGTINSDQGLTVKGNSVGIGTGNPGTNLDVNGSAHVSGNLGIGGPAGTKEASIVNLFAGNASLSLVPNNSNSWFHIYNNNSNALQISYGNTISSSTSILTANSTGKVGIGTTTPRTTLDVRGAVTIGVTAPPSGTAYMLAVAGQIYAQEIDVTPSITWSDYVFKKDYKLASLTEVEKYIKENGHLEHVPSAEQVAKIGYKVGEMDATLLRKVEELTLYVIELKKEVSELKAKK